MKRFFKFIPILLILCFSTVFAENYVHYEWTCVQKDGSNVAQSDTITENKTYTTAKFYSNGGNGLPANCIGTQTKNTYTVTLNGNGGTVSGGLSYQSDGSFKLPTNVTKTGYTFTGWTGSNGTTAQTDVTVSATTSGNLTYTASWKADLPTSFSVVSSSGRLYNINADTKVYANQLYVAILLGNTSDRGAGNPKLSTNVSTSNSNILYHETKSVSGNKRQEYLVFIPKSDFNGQFRASCDSQQTGFVLLKGNTAMSYSSYNSSSFSFTSASNNQTISRTGSSWSYSFLATSWYDTSEPSTSVSNAKAFLDKTYSGDAGAKVRIRVYNSQNTTITFKGSTSSSLYPVQNYGALIISKN